MRLVLSGGRRPGQPERREEIGISERRAASLHASPDNNVRISVRTTSGDAPRDEIDFHRRLERRLREPVLDGGGGEAAKGCVGLQVTTYQRRGAHALEQEAQGGEPAAAVDERWTYHERLVAKAARNRPLRLSLAIKVSFKRTLKGLGHNVRDRDEDEALRTCALREFHDALVEIAILVAHDGVCRDRDSTRLGLWRA